MPNKLVQVRLPEDFIGQMERRARERGQTLSAYMRQSLRDDMDEASRDERLAALEDRIAASLNRMSRELKSARQDTQLVIAMFDMFVRQYLLHTPPVPADAVKAAAASADDRHEKWVRGFLSEVQAPDGLVSRLRELLLSADGTEADSTP